MPSVLKFGKLPIGGKKIARQIVEECMNLLTIKFACKTPSTPEKP